jgi:hypothetical protein
MGAKPALLAAAQACIDSFPWKNRGIAQPGSAAVLGTAGRWFESSCPDQQNQLLSEKNRCPIFPENSAGKIMGRPVKYF